MKDKNDALASAHADLVKYKDKRENQMNVYMTSPEFQELMTKHDEGLYPTLFPVGWNAGVRAVKEKFPAVDPASFKPPTYPIIIKQLMEILEDLEMKEGESEDEEEEDPERILDPNVTPLRATADQSSSSSSSFSSEDEEGGQRDMDSEPSNVV